MLKTVRGYLLTGCTMVLLFTTLSSGGSLKAPPGMFKDLTEDIIQDAIIINGKQLFIDDYIIGELKGAQKVLNQPVKHPANPVLGAKLD